MPQVGFELTIPMFQRAKTVHTLDSVATLIGEAKFYWTLEEAVYMDSVLLQRDNCNFQQ
jgi:hypothetical protein